MLRPLLFSLLLSVAAIAADDQSNTLSSEEKAAGWKLLFDGKSPAGWVAIGKTEFPASGWVVQDGELQLMDGTASVTVHPQVRVAAAG